MDINNLLELLNAKINDDARRAGVMTLGGLRSLLELLPPKTPVVVDEGGSLGDLDSYRGYYERLAFEPSNGSTTASEVLNALNYADGEIFHGYKGGEYAMDGSTFLHVARYGATGPQIVGMHVDDGQAVIETEREEF